MYKALSLLLVLSLICTSCKKGHQKPGCPAQVCTDIFATVTIKFIDKAGNQITVDNYSSVDQRTHKVLIDDKIVSPGTFPPFYAVVTDSNLKDLSTDGDDILVSGTNHTTGETKTALLKVSGGCNCHVTKISGADEINF